MARRRAAGMVPLTPKRKWQTLTLATILLVFAYWSVLAGIVDGAVGDDTATNTDLGNGSAYVALGLALLPFVFIILAFMSGHPRAPGAVVKAMLLAVAVGVPVSAFAADAVTGIVAGVGAGGAVALRPEPDHGWKPRAVGVLVATAYTFVLVRAAGLLALVSAPIFPLTALGLADSYVDWRRQPRPAGG